MKEIITNAYKYEELSATAKEVARDEYRENGLDYDWYDCTLSDAKEIASFMGIEIEDIYFSGFSSQGDGACFTGYYRYKSGSAKAVRSHAPIDSKLNKIADDLIKVQARDFYQLTARVTHWGHYNHSGCTHIEVERRSRPGGTFTRFYELDL